MFGGARTWPNSDALQKAGMNPLELYTQFMQQWQKNLDKHDALLGQGRKDG